MRRLCIISVLAAVAVIAQENAPIGILRGDLVAWSGTARAGLLTFRNADNHLLECGFDDKTWFEHANEYITISAMRAGDHLEMVADRKLSSSACYARTIEILDTTLPRRTESGKRRLRSSNSVTELFAPRGEMTFAGIVMEIDNSHLTLLTRDRGRHVLLLRPDTRYLGGGVARERSNLGPQTLIYVRAGRNLEGGIEAYSIVWGEILKIIN